MVNNTQKKQLLNYTSYIKYIISQYFNNALFVTNSVDTLFSLIPATFRNLLLLAGDSISQSYYCILNCEMFEDTSIFANKIEVSTGKENEENVKIIFFNF